MVYFERVSSARSAVEYANTDAFIALQSMKLDTRLVKFPTVFVCVGVGKVKFAHYKQDFCIFLLVQFL